MNSIDRASELRGKKDEEIGRSTLMVLAVIQARREVEQLSQNDNRCSTSFAGVELDRQPDEIGARTRVRRVVVNGARLPL